MATFTVTTASDVVNAGDGQLSLREAVGQANATAAAESILFTPALEGQTLTLTRGELRIMQDVSLDGDRDNNGSQVTLDGNDRFCVLLVAGSGGVDLGATDLDIVDEGFDAPVNFTFGGGVTLLASNTLAMRNCTVTSCENLFGGGLNLGAGTRATIVGSAILDNITQGGSVTGPSFGGGIYADAATTGSITGSAAEPATTALTAERATTACSATAAPTSSSAAPVTTGSSALSAMTA